MAAAVQVLGEGGPVFFNNSLLMVAQLISIVQLPCYDQCIVVFTDILFYLLRFQRGQGKAGRSVARHGKLIGPW